MSVEPPAEFQFYCKERHRGMLAVLAARQLASGHAEHALALIDRRLRTGPPSVEDHLLKAAVLRELANRRTAAAEMVKALHLDPTDPNLLRELMRASNAELRHKSCELMTANTHASVEDLREAVRTLADACAIILHAEMRGSHVTGWCCWRGEEPAELTLFWRDGSRTDRLDPDPTHVLSGAMAYASSFSIPAPDAPNLGVEVRAGTERLSRNIVPLQDRRLRVSHEPNPAVIANRPRAVHVIVPVYDDVETTRACLTALGLQTDQVRTIVVTLINDCGPDPAMAGMLEEAAARYRFRLLTNERNLGYVAAVNRALATVEDADVLLLNADVILPPAAIAALARIAEAHPDVGTLVPFSNNSEFTSFPSPNEEHPLPSIRDLARLNIAAQHANGDRIVDIPAGTGFCLYIKAETLREVGTMSTLYKRGYCEDTDFCFVARERGLRNVCATGVFVGHAGTRSFGGEKRGLVIRNRRVLEGRFPHVRPSSLAFAAADPLKSARAALEFQEPPTETVRLFVARAGLPSQFVVDGIEIEPTSALDLILNFDRALNSIMVRGLGGGGPRSLSFSIWKQQDRSRLRAYLAKLAIERVEIVDAHAMPRPILGMLAKLGKKVRLWVSAGHDLPCGTLSQAKCRDEGALCPGCTVSGRKIVESQGFRHIVKRATQVAAADAIAASFARKTYGRRAVARARVPSPTFARARRTAVDNIGLLSPNPVGTTEALARALASEIKRRGMSQQVVVIGSTSDDLQLMSLDRLFVTGPIGPNEMDSLLHIHGIGFLVQPLRFGHAWLGRSIAIGGGLLLATFDWSGERRSRASRDDADLLLNPYSRNVDIAGQLADWVHRHAAGLAG